MVVGFSPVGSNIPQRTKRCQYEEIWILTTTNMIEKIDLVHPIFKFQH